MPDARQTLTIEVLMKADQAIRGLAKTSNSQKDLNKTAKLLTAGMVGVRTEINNGVKSLVAFDKQTGRYVKSGVILRTVTDGVNQKFGEMAQDAQEAAHALDTLKKAQGSVQNAMGLTATQAGTAGFALTNLGQIFADSGQFSLGMAQGIRAVNNNIQQFMFSMTLLVGSMGSVTKAMQAMVSLMRSPVGFLVVFQLATAAMEFFSNKAQQAESALKKTKDAFKEATDAAIKFTDQVKPFGVEDADVPRVLEFYEKRLDAARQLTGFLEDANLEEIRQNQHLELNRSLMARAVALSMQLGSSELLTTKETDRQLKAHESIVESLKQRQTFIQNIQLLSRLLGEGGLTLVPPKETKKKLTDIEKIYADIAATAVKVNAEDHVRIGNLRNTLRILKENLSAEERRAQLQAQLRGLSELGVAAEFDRETAAIERANEVLEERIRIKQQLLGIQDIEVNQLRQLTTSTDQLARELEELRTKEEEALEAHREAVQTIAAATTQIMDSIASFATTMFQTQARSAQLAREETFKQIEADVALGNITESEAQRRKNAADDEFKSRIEAAENWFRAQKAIAIASAIISTYAGAAKAFEQTGVLGFVSGAAIIAAGMAHVATIIATKPGVSTAARSGVGGGGGGFAGNSTGGLFGSGQLGGDALRNVGASASNIAGVRAPAGGNNVTFRIAGRDLIGAIDNNNAAQARIIGTS